MNAPHHILQHTFGFDHFKPNQKEIIDCLMAGNDCFALMPTGGGKSLCYQIPAILKKGTGIVVSPLISLMKDQVTALQDNGVQAAFYNSSLTYSESQHILTKLHNNQLDLLYVSPERLLMPDFIERLKTVNIALLAIDEAHCVSQWGHDFRPEYRQIIQVRNLFPDVPVIALTATADKPTRMDILKYLGLKKPKIIVASFDRPNICYLVKEKNNPLGQVKTFLNKHANEAGIIYCFSRKRVEELCSKLKENGYSAMSYHAGLTTKDRNQAQEAFQRDDVQVIVATIAFGMGIDKPNVRFVVHYDMPKHIENYYQETGRAGRDGLPSDALLLFGLSDVGKINGLISQITDENQRRVESHKLSTMIGYADAQTCRRKVLLNYFGEPLEQDCGNCDICLSPPEIYDATVDAQKALSCIYRLNQRFGLGYLVDVLRGKNSDRIIQFHHDQLSTYGIGKDLSQHEWYSIIRQLIHRGFIEQDIVNFSVLKLTPEAKPLLRGEIKLNLARPPKKELTIETPKKVKIKSTTIQDDDKALFEALRKKRKQLADAMGKPPFVIFSDASLIEMAAKKPKTPAEFRLINGVGDYKLQQYGNTFIEIICGSMSWPPH